VTKTESIIKTRSRRLCGAAAIAVMLACGGSCSSDDAEPKSGASGNSQTAAGASSQAGVSGTTAAAGSSGRGQDAGNSSSAQAGASGARAAAGASAGASGSSQPEVDASGDGGTDQVTFTELYDTVFKKFCNLCHYGGTLQPDLSTRAAAYQSLVNAPANPSGQCSKLGLKRVEPGDPAKSLLAVKLSTQKAACGQQMPPGGELKPELRQAIEQWIAAGAHDD
jgi:hypothetical protein